MVFHWYGFFIGLGAIAALFVVQKSAGKFRISLSLIESGVLWIAIPAILGARIYHLLTDWSLYVERSLWDWLAIWNGGLGFFGAVIGGLLGLIFYTYRVWKQDKIPSFTRVSLGFLLADLYSFGLPVGQAIGRIGNYFNQELYGTLTTVPWGIEINSQFYHPLFAYEGVFLLLLFIGIQLLSSKQLLTIGKGQYFSLYIVFYGLIRFWLEFLRIDSARWGGMFGVLTIAQWVCLGMMGIGVVIFWTRRHSCRGKESLEWDFSLN